METGTLARGDDALRLPRLRASAHGARRRWSAIGPGVRLILVLVLALVLTGGAAYLLISDEMRTDQIDAFSRLQEADARGLETVSAGLSEPAAVAAAGKGLEAIREREGVSEALLIGPDGVVRASGGGKPVGSVDDDPSTLAILRGGPSYAGTEQDETEDKSNFEFLVPIELGGERFVLETAYDSASFEDQLSHIREILALLMLAAIPTVLLAFYLLGGRALLRGHRLALERATRDGLTDLPNHRAFQDEFEQAVSLAQRNGDPLALALIDLDNFKQVNDRHGHPEGDAILRRLAEILRNGRSADRPFRIGGDEFALMLQRTDAAGARRLSQRLAKTLTSAGIPASVGVATLYPGENAKDLRSEADAALYEAKRAGGGRAALFADIRGPIAITTAAKRDAVNRLIDEGELETVFQPIWALDSELLVGLEALSRPDPDYGLTGPEEAFDIAEQLGRVPELDRLCAATALGNADAVLPPQALLFLNIAPKSLELGSESVEWIAGQVEAAELATEQVVIEVSERFPARTAPVADSLVALRKRGFQLALDDVGTGNSGLEMLRRIGADYVKLDRSIVAAAATEPNARGVLMAMATYARQTGAFVIAEGIEDEETLAFLRGIQASDFAPQTIIQGGQGFALGAPDPQPSLEISRRSAARSPSGG
ncbi:MAG TPA: EAL domain-containing protein [Solirubrobacterales bacterium]|nr:EAL domain-containing protein [Solirubrobacterales bacterium]